MPEQSAKQILDEAVRAYASPGRPTMATCHRSLAATVGRENHRRAVVGLPLLRCPSPRTVQRAIRGLDPYEVHAARHGSASANRRFRRLRGCP